MMDIVHTLTFLFGASGAGKTTVAKILERSGTDAVVLHFDDIGVPSPEEMIRVHGSGESWQRAMTLQWVETIRATYLDDRNVLLELQANPAFIQEACALHGITKIRYVLLDCTDDVRRARLAARGQPELADTQMLNWARVLREESRAHGYIVIDTSTQSPEESVASVLAL